MKVYCGSIVILRSKNNTGNIKLDSGGNSSLMEFPANFEDGDKVKAVFVDDDPSKKIISLHSDSEEWHYGRIINFNIRMNKGLILSSFPKLLDNAVSFDISEVKNNDEFKRLLRDEGHFTPLEDKKFILKGSFVLVRFKLHKDKDNITAKEIELLANVSEENIRKTISPYFGEIVISENISRRKQDAVHSGVIIRYNEDKGFGFIRSDKKDNVFFHFSNYKNCFKKMPEEGLNVRFTMSKGEKGLAVTEFLNNEESSKYYFKTKTETFPVFEKDFINFKEPLPDDIFYIYGKGRNVEIYRVNQNKISQLINCYKNKNTAGKLRLKAVDKLIEADLSIKNLDRMTLLSEKKALLSSCYSSENDPDVKRQYLMDIQRFSFKPSMLNSSFPAKFNLSPLNKTENEYRFGKAVNLSIEALSNTQMQYMFSHSICRISKEHHPVQSLTSFTHKYKILNENTSCKKADYNSGIYTKLIIER